MSMVIFTGMDNTGKTTLIEKVSRVENVPIIRSMGPNFTKEQKDKWIKKQIVRDRSGKKTLYDRFLPFEEMVYGKVLRNGPLYSLDDSLMMQLKSCGPHIIYTRPPVDRILNFGTREQMEGVIPKATELIQEWDSLMWALMARGWNINCYDYTTDFKEELQ